MNFWAFVSSFVLVGWVLSGAYVYTCKYKMLCDEMSNKVVAVSDTTKTDSLPITVDTTTKIEKEQPTPTNDDPQGKFKPKEIEILKTTQLVYFKTGSTTMIETPEGIAYLSILKNYLETYPNSNIILTGHTDNAGNEEINVPLGIKRAENVKEQLVKKGIKAAQIKTDSRGSSQPVAENTTEVGRYKNRRVEILFQKQ